MCGRMLIECIETMLGAEIHDVISAACGVEFELGDDIRENARVANWGAGNDAAVVPMDVARHCIVAL